MADLPPGSSPHLSAIPSALLQTPDASADLPGPARRRLRARTDRVAIMGFVSPTGPGSLGDQAMLDAATAYATQRMGRGALVFPDGPRLRTSASVAHGGGPLATIAATGRGALAAGALVYIGADVLDGSYSAAASLKRLNVLRFGHLLGRATRVMGSSWSTMSAPEVTAFLKKARWLDVLARDPVSQRRMEAKLDRPVRLVADLGFLLDPEARSPAARAAVAWARREKAAGATILAANLSGHTIRTLPGQSIMPFAGLVSRWLDADPRRRILILPHDTRPGMGGDLTVCADLAATLRERYATRLHVPDGTLDAWDAKALVGEVDLVLTGRMHLAIAALGMGTPPVSIVYRDKFEGLMAHLGLEDDGLTLAPDAVGRTADADAQLAAATRGRTALRRRIAVALPRIRFMAQQNFAGL